LFIFWCFEKDETLDLQSPFLLVDFFFSDQDLNLSSWKLQNAQDSQVRRFVVISGREQIRLKDVEKTDAKAWEGQTNI